MDLMKESINCKKKGCTYKTRQGNFMKKHYVMIMLNTNTLDFLNTFTIILDQ